MEQTDLLRRVIRVLEEQQITYMLVGSFASGAYGEPRLTQGIDIVVDLDTDQVDALYDAFPAEEYYVSREAAAAAVRQGGQFNVIHPDSGNKIDFMMARKDAWGRTQLQRRQKTRILPDHDAFLARPEDIILGKMDYYRQGGSEKHLRDITGILRVSGEHVDRSYVGEWSRRLGLAEIWRSVLRRLGQAPDEEREP